MTTVLKDAPLAGRTDELELVTFYVDDALMGIPVDQVEEINHHLELSPVPHGPASVRGLMNLRGEVVTVIDLRVVLGLEPAAITRRSRNIVVRWQGEQIGILIDRVGDVIRARRSDLDPPPANLIGADGRRFQGVCKLENSLLLLLHVAQILGGEPSAN